MTKHRLYVHRVADSGYGTDLFTVNDSSVGRNRSTYRRAARLRSAGAQDQSTQAAAATSRRDDALLAIPSEENLDNIVSNQLEYLCRVQEITHGNGASSDNGATVTATDQQPGPISEVLLPSYQAQCGPGFSSNDSCTSLEDNNLIICSNLV